MGKKYWLKMGAHFFKGDEMVYLRSLPNGYEYIYLWQSLLLKCLDVVDEQDIGFLRMNDKIPYSPELFSQIFGLNIDIIRSAIEIFVKIGLIEVLEDGTVYIEKVQQLIGKESCSAERVRLHRERKKIRESQMLPCNAEIVTSNTYKKEEEEVEIEKDKDKGKSKKMLHNPQSNPPSLEEWIEYSKSKGYSFDYENAWSHYASNGWKQSNGNKIVDWRPCARTCQGNHDKRVKEKSGNRELFRSRNAFQESLSPEQLEVLYKSKQKEMDKMKQRGLAAPDQKLIGGPK